MFDKDFKDLTLQEIGNECQKYHLCKDCPFSIVVNNKATCYFSLEVVPRFWSGMDFMLKYFYEERNFDK